jgi:hypothetical protein
MLRIKRETQQSLVFHLKDFQENLKFKCLFSLTEAVVRRLSPGRHRSASGLLTDFGR